MKYELANLDNFIEVNFNPSHLLSEFKDEDDFKFKISFLRLEKERIRFDLINEVVSFNDDFKSRFHIQQHQKALIFLSNRLNSYQEQIIEHIGDYLLSNFISLFQEVNRCIDFLLDFIQQHFNKYFDNDSLVSDSYYGFMKCQIFNTISIIKRFDCNEDDENLYNLVANVLEIELIADKYKYTYRHTCYLKQLLLLLLEMPDRLDFELFSLNFNDPFFYKYYSSKIVIQISQVESKEEKIIKMRTLLNQINQVNLRPNLFFRVDCPAINCWIYEWLKEEILFHEKGITPLMIMPSNERGEFIQSKYALNLSVGQVGLLSRLIMEFCFIERPVYKRVAKDISKVFRTKKAGKTEDLSTESIFGKFYKHDSATKEIMVEILLRMVKRIREL